MGKFVINGGKKLYGSVKIQGAKNAVLPMIAGALLTEEEVLIENCPKINDVISMTKILNDLGVKTSFIDCGLLINSSSIDSYAVNKKMLGRIFRFPVAKQTAIGYNISEYMQKRGC